MPLAVAVSGGLGPILSFDVVDDGAFAPAQQRRNYQTHAFAGSGRSKGQDMLGTVMTKIVKPLLSSAVPSANINALPRAHQTCCFHIGRTGPARGAVKIFCIL